MGDLDLRGAFWFLFIVGLLFGGASCSTVSYMYQPRSIIDCEKSLPRSEKCVLIAVPIKQKRDS